MAKFKTYCFEIKVLTNMHVGSGDATYSIVDKLVQRDPVTGNPTIHASSLKGALREFFEKEFDIDKFSTEDLKTKLDVSKPDELRKKFINYIFGSSPKEKDKLQSGVYRFFSADLFLLPVRSSYNQYYLATSKPTIEYLNNKFKLLGINLPDISSLLSVEDPSKPIIWGANITEKKVLLEDSEAEIVKDSIPINSRYDQKVSLWDSRFSELVDNLPVIARNQLENGQSANLWYEEIVPHQTRFITFISVPEEDKTFTTFLSGLNELIQIGANGSIGYGLCEFILKS